MGAGSTAVKGAVWRAQAACLDELRWRDRVCAELSASSRALVVDPPSVVEWVSLDHPIALCAAIERLYGPDELARFGAASSAGLLDTSLRPVLQGIFAVFGANPHSLFSRSELVIKAVVRGGRATYTRIGDRECEVEYFMDWPEIPASYWRIWKASLVHGFTLCRCAGTIASPTLTDNGRYARFRLQWQ